MTKVIAVVYKDNTLGLLGETFGRHSIEVLFGFVSKGGKSSMDSPILFVDASDFRQATLQDFKTFRVHHHTDYQVATNTIQPLKVTEL
jgi:hypothetical protein